MYAQITTLQCPLGKMEELNKLIAQSYLPELEKFDGFISAYVMQRIDDPDTAEIVQFWENQAAVENMHRTGMLKSSVTALVARLPGLRMRGQSYIVRVSTGELAGV